MQFGRSLDKFIKLFYYCGLSCYPSFDGFLIAKSKRPRLMHYIPTAALSVLIVILVIGPFVPLALNGSYTLFLVIYSLWMLVTLLPCTIQMFFLRSNFAKIWSHVTAIELMSRESFLGASKAMQRHFMRRVYFECGLFFLKMLMFFWSREKKFTWLNIGLHGGPIMLRVIMILVTLHAFFYIILLDHLLECVARQVDSRISYAAAATMMSIMTYRRPSANQVASEMLQFKLLHYHVWKVSVKINRLFGWTICLTFLHHFVSAVYNVHEAYILSREPLNWFKFLRKFIEFEERLRAFQFCSSCTGTVVSFVTYLLSISIFADACHRCGVWVICLRFSYD